MCTNEFMLKGKYYIAVSVTADHYCEGCSFDNEADCYEVPTCDESIRSDERRVIFVEKNHDQP